MLQDEGGVANYGCVRDLHAIVRDCDRSDAAGGEELPEDKDRKRSGSKDESRRSRIRKGNISVAIFRMRSFREGAW